jgi:outer membrane protein
MEKAMTKPQIALGGYAGDSGMGDIITGPPGVMPQGIFSVPNKGAVVGQVGLMYPISTGGKLSGAVNSAKALSSAAAFDREAAQKDTAFLVKSAYRKALLAQSTAGVYQDLVDEEKERVRVAQASYDEGKIAKYDLLRNRAALAESEQMLSNAERDVQTGMIDLKASMGISQESEITLSGALSYSPVAGDLASYIKQAMENRPELASARARVKAADEKVKAAQGAYSPQVYLSAMQGVTATSGETSSGFTGGLTVGIPLSDGGSRRAAASEAESMLSSMKQEEKQAAIEVQREVRSAWVELQAADKNVKLSETAVEQAREDYRVIKLRYEAGKSINVEVLDALASLTRAENNNLTALYECNAAQDKLTRAVGGM